MRKMLGLLLAGTALFLGGCVITSVYPFYTDKDVAFDAKLLGEWSENEESKEVWKFTKAGTNKYLFQVIEPDKHTDMKGYLFKLNGQVFLDLLGTEQTVTAVPVHLLMKVDLADPKLEMAGQSTEWLEATLRQNPAALRHHRIAVDDGDKDYRIVLTAETSDLQSFLTKHKDNPAMWEKTNSLKRRAVPAK